MIKILDTKEVAKRIGKSVRRTQELIDGNTFPRLEIWENDTYRLGVREEVLNKYLASTSGRNATKRA